MKKQGIVLIAIGGLLVVSFQNCAKMNFAPVGQTVMSESASADQAIDNGETANVPPKDEVVDLGSTTSFACKQFVEVAFDPSRVLNIPKRDGRGLCYVMKIISKVDFEPSSDNPSTDSEVISRNHDGLPQSHHPYVLGSQVVRMVLGGERAIKLSGGKDDKKSILVDNFILIGVAPSALLGNSNYYNAYGTSDSALYNTNTILFKNNEIPVKAFSTGGVSTIAPLSLEGLVEYNREYSLDIRGLDAGGSGHISDIYLLFQ